MTMKIQIFFSAESCETTDQVLPQVDPLIKDTPLKLT